jgi:ferritin-like metal-binding protein YciE
VTNQQMSMQSPQELFAYELSVMHAFEQRNVRMLEQLLQETPDELARRPIRLHLEETREQVRLLEESFRTLGWSPRAADVQAAEGMSRDHETFKQLGPAPEVLTLHNLDTAAKIEHLEVAAYRSLLGRALLMGQAELAQTLKHILQQEEFAVAALESAQWQLGERAAGLAAAVA